jgi:LPXTG-motif cell wall-anchored protein
MKKYLTAVATAMVALLAVVLGATGAQAYPSPVFDVTVNHQVLVGGNPFTARAHASVQCHDWTLKFLGQSASNPGKNFTHTFSTPVVDKKTVYPLHATCVYSASASTSDPTYRTSIPITLLPKGHHNHHNGGGLPNTGGPSFWLLVVAILLVLAGVVALIRSRRRQRPTA